MWVLLAGCAALVAACSDDDPDARRADSGLRDAGTEADGGSIGPQELARRLEQVERELRDARQRLADLTPPNGDQELLARLAQPLVAAMCARAERCCTGDELVLQLGEGASSAQTCESQLLSLAQRAASPSLKGVDAAIFQWLSEALALQRGTAFELDADAVPTCAEALARAACEHADDGRCQTPDRDDPCQPARLLRSLARSGAACEPGSSVPQCAGGLTCKALPAGGARCVEEGKAGDACAQDADCANDSLFCGPTIRRCEQRRELGEACSHASEATALDGCARGLVCDSKVCVPACTTGAACDPAHDNRDCAAGLVCVGYSARCAPPENVRECVRDSECGADARCVPIASTDGPRCARILAPGAQCTPYVLACDGGLCVTDPSAPNGGVCKASCAGDEVCASDQYCATTCSQFTRCSPSAVGCNPRLPDGSVCFVNSSFSDARNDRQCASGHCDHASHTCLPRRAADSACERSAQCPTTQYCQTGACQPLLAAASDCTGLAADACGPGSFCRDNAGQRTCTIAPRQGDACDWNTGLVCLEGAGLTCLGQRCVLERGRPLESECSSDTECATGHCDLYNRCRKRIPEGDGCAPPVAGLDHDDCEAGTYCGPNGECTPRGTAGMPCDTRYSGRDCLSSKGPYKPGQCFEREATWRCAADALAPGSALCDGK